MNTMRTIRLVLWGLVAAMLAFGAVLWSQQRAGDVALLPEIRLGAPFALVDQKGAPITEKAFEGRPVALFFGFTHCPEVCPTTLYEMTGWFDALGDAGKDIGAYFVTVDPERDTPELMADYLASFPRVTGITGPVDDVAALASAWKVYWKKVPLEGGDYTMDHTASVFLVRRDGSLMGTIAYGESANAALAKLRRLAES
jgi:protein SCO1